jgi:hypothetical protein
MIRSLAACAIALVAGAAGQAQNPPEPIRLTIQPAPVPVPALKYLLLPDAQEQTPGNAAMLYYRAFSPEWEGWRRRPGLQDRMGEALQTPLDKLPRKDFDWLLGSKQFRELDLAARREYCDWQLTERIRTEGIGMLLPDVQSFRIYGTALALRSRLYLADRNFDQAAYSLQTGFALGRDVGDAPVLISSLVGVAICTVQAGQVDQWLQTPGSPNLYWALTDLPRPLVSLRRAVRSEKIWLQAEVPELRDIENTRLGSTQIQGLLDHFVRLQRYESNMSETELRMAFMGLVAKFYPEAKRSLIARGRKPEDVEALPMVQVYVLHALHQYQAFQDDLYKWLSLPFPEGLPGLQETDKKIAEAKKNLQAPSFLLLLPAIHKVYAATTRLDRRIAAQRCLEAIRLYAAVHDGRLPAALADISEVPVPEDPMRGKPFEYKQAGDKATLHAPDPFNGATPSNALTYELTLQK